MENPEPDLKRNIGLFGAASVGIANTIGAGILIISGVAAAIWFTAGLLTYHVMSRKFQPRAQKQ